MPAFQSRLGASRGVGEANFIIVIITNNDITGTAGDNILLISLEYGSFTLSAVRERLRTFICVYET